MLTIKAPVRTFECGDFIREYVNVSLTFEEAWPHFSPDLFKPASQQGEQRGITSGHARKIRKEMEEGNFTPTSWSAGLRDEHRKKVRHDKETGLVTFDIDPDHPVPLTDAGHRRHVMRELVDAKKMPPTCPVDVLIMLDGETRQDFINLQQGKPVDTTHMLSLKVLSALLSEKDQPFAEFALEVAQKLNRNSCRQYNKMIRFASEGQYPIKLSSLMLFGKGDGATSLVGLARVAMHLKWKVDAAVRAVVKTTEYLVAQGGEELTGPGQTIACPPDHTAGSVGMVLGVCTLAIYRAAVAKSALDEAFLGRVLQSCREVLGGPAGGNLGIPQKRTLMGAFARDYFADFDVPKHDGVPVELLQVMVPKAYECSAFPKGKSSPAREEAPTQDGEKESEEAA